VTVLLLTYVSSPFPSPLHQISVSHDHTVTWFRGNYENVNMLVDAIIKNATTLKLVPGQRYTLQAYGEDVHSVFEFQNIDIVQSDGPDSFQIHQNWAQNQ